jgi:hypothetical protein
MCTSTAIWIFRCLNEWLRSIARLPEANVTFNERGNKSEAETTVITCLFLAFADRGREGWSIQIGRGEFLPCRQNGSPSVYLLCMIPSSKSTSLSQRVCSGTTMSSPPVAFEQGAARTIVEEGYAHAVVVVFIEEDESQS